MGRPVKAEGEKRRRRQVYVTDAEWSRLSGLLSLWRRGALEASVESVMSIGKAAKVAVAANSVEDGSASAARIATARPVKGPFESPAAYQRRLAEWEPTDA